MKINIIMKLLLIALLFIPITLKAQDTVFLKQQARRMAQATFKGDYKTIISLTYPKLTELTGGPEKLQKLIEEKISSLKKRGIIRFGGSVDSPGAFYNAGDEIHCLLPEVVILYTANGRYIGRSYLLGITNDQGKSWSFLDVGNMPAAMLHRLLPSYNDRLVIPSPAPPTFFPD